MSLGQPTPPNARKKARPTRVLVAKARPDSLQGRVILNKYRINSRLARGGMATIYLSRHVKDGSLYAVKVLRRDMVLEASARIRFLNECHAIQRIDHPNVVRIYDVGEMEDTRICLVMEFVDGVSLRDIIKRGPIPTSNVVSIAQNVSKGLNAAHQNCIVHRDLKPENVLVTRGSPKSLPGKNDEVKLVDFGIARIIDAPRITTTQHIMGTPQYIAPEQALGQNIDHRVDIYALGVMMYEMLSGELPFPGDDPDILLRQHISIPPPPLNSWDLTFHIPDELNNLVMRCLSKSPKNRPADLDEVQSVLASLY